MSTAGTAVPAVTDAAGTDGSTGTDDPERASRISGPARGREPGRLVRLHGRAHDGVEVAVEHLVRLYALYPVRWSAMRFSGKL